MDHGSLIGLPVSTTMKGIFYNKDWFDRSTLPYPDDNWTWDDFMRSAGHMDSERAIEAVQWAADFIRVHKMSVPTLQYFSTRSFAQGKCGMTLEFYLTLFELETKLKDRLGVAPIPSFKPEYRSNPAGLGMSSASKNREIAWEVLSLLASDNVYTRNVTVGGTPALNKRLLEKGYFHEPNSVREILHIIAQKMDKALIDRSTFS